MPRNRSVDDIIRIKFSGGKISKDKKYKKQNKEKIINAVCALLNSNGGKVEVRVEETKGNLVSTKTRHSLTRTLEQSLETRWGAEIKNSVATVDDNNAKAICTTVRKGHFLFTTAYNLYRPTQKQVKKICNIPDAFEITNRSDVDHPVQRGSHHKTFHKGQNCGSVENEINQFKLLTSDPSKRVTLADRMTGKSNKFSCYVSAFANHRGGHIYYGIDDDGVVHGEKTENFSEIEKKVEKAIKKMIWPDVIGQPKRGEHWEIFFQPVLDEKSNPIPSTYVIVIFIAPCFGGVFTEEPESYEMVQGKVERMSFTTWKEKLQPVGQNKRKLEVPSTTERISLSLAASKRCTQANEDLVKSQNNGEWANFAKWASKLERENPNNLEVKLVVLVRNVFACYRTGNIHQAYSLINDKQASFIQAEEPFKSLYQFLKKAFELMSGKSAKYRDIATDAITIVKHIEQGLFTVAPLLVAASTYEYPENDAELSPDTLCEKALKHLNHVSEDAPITRADLYFTAHITLAAYHLGYNLSGKMIKKDIDKESFEKAQDSIMAVNKSICDGNALTEYREIWFTLVKSTLYIRFSQFESKREEYFIKEAIKFAKKAETLAKDSGLVKMVCWAQTIVNNM